MLSLAINGVILFAGPHKHQSAVTCLQFNEKFVITSSDDGTVKLWDVNTGRKIVLFSEEVLNFVILKFFIFFFFFLTRVLFSICLNLSG